MNTPKLHTLAMAATLLIPAMMTAQVDRTHAPAPGPAPEVHLGGHKSFTLPNGMRVIIVENHKIPIVNVQVKFDIPPIKQGDIAGYQDLVGELLTSGTPRHTKEQIDELVDGMGARLSGANDGIYGSCLTKNFPKLMDLVYEVIASANYPRAEFEKAKKRLLSSIEARSSDPDQIADVVGHALTFGKGHPYGEVSTESSVGKVTRDNVYQYYRYFFQPGHGYLVLVGDIDEPTGKAMAEKFFGTWKGAEVPVTKDRQGHDVVKGLGPIIPAHRMPRAASDRRVAFVDRPGSAQSVIKVLFPEDLKPNDPMAMDARVMNTILGGGAFNTRLMQNLREDKGYTYGAYSTLDADRWTGHFSAGCSVRNAVTDSAAEQVMAEIVRMRKEPVTKDELALAKSNMAGNFARALEDPKTIARFVLNTYLNKLPEDYYETYLKRLDTVSIAGVDRAAERFLKPDSATILVVGDKEKVANSLAPLATAKAVAYYDVNGDIYREKAEPAPAGMTAQDVLDAYVKAIGGRDALEKVKDLKKEYSATVQGMPATMTEYFQSPDKYAKEMKMGGTLMQKTIYDGTRAISTGIQGDKELIDVDLQRLQKNIYAFPEIHYKEMQNTAHLAGIVDVNGKKTYRLLVQTLEGDRFTEYYDTTTGLKLRRTEAQQSEGGPTVQIETDYSDYKPVDGVLFPKTIKQHAGMNIAFTATDISVNQGIDPGTFNTH